MSPACPQCHIIISILQQEVQGQNVRCPLCSRRYIKGWQWVFDEDGYPVNEIWQESDRPTYCTKCNWTGPMRLTVYLEGDCFPHRCPKCGAVVANWKGEE
ncbi:MAG: hypothetical protein GXX95_00845 [Methanomassiliicoccus sp.]|nr:hypothetical protein [Methanomassiliicoccus sp.]